MCMTKTELDAIDAVELFDIDIETIVGFHKDVWKPVWIQAVSYWTEDGSSWYDYVINGFKGWVERSEFEIYCDLRFTYIDGRSMSWDELWTECQELGKFS